MTSILKRLTGPVLDRAQRQAMGMMTSYFNWYFDRAIVVDTDDGLVVTDPFNRTRTTELTESLRHAGIDAPCHTVIYSHFHGWRHQRRAH